MNPSQPSPADVQDVLDVLREAGFSSAYWRPLGRRLKPDLDLEAIERNHPTVERRLEDVVSGWQRDGENKWEILAEAVSQCREGGGKNIAQKIRERVGLGHVHNCDLPRQGSGDSAIGSEERQSVSSSITLLSPVGLFPNRQLGEMLSGKDVKAAVSDLNTQFNEMVLDTQDTLQESRADPRRIANILRLGDAQFSYTPPEVFDSLRMAADVIDLFAQLDKYWDHFNYHLLDRLILTRPAERLFAKHLRSVYRNLRERMTQYKEDIDYFRRHTDVEVYCQAVRQPRKEIPADFKELVKECDLKTLQDVEEFRQEVAYDYKLCECLVFWKYINMGSVIITLWIPRSAEPIGRLLNFYGDTDGSSVDPFPVLEEAEIMELPSDDEPPLPTQCAEDGSSVDPVSLTDEAEASSVGDLPSHDDPLLPSQSQKTSERMQVIARRESMVSSVLTTVSKLVLPKYVIDPIVLMRAVSNGNKSEVEDLISKGANPNASPPMIEFTPLMEASRLGNVEIAQLLLDKHADPNLTNTEGWTALMAAANNGRFGTTDVLLQKGANPDLQGDSGWSALMAAVYKRHDDVALRIIEAGATPHIQDKNHTNALLLAIATNKNDKVVDALLDHVHGSRELDLQDSYGETALIFACKMGSLKFVKRLLSMEANPDIANNHKETPVLIATQLGMKEILKELLEKGANPNKGAVPPLHVATASDLPSRQDIVDLLLLHKADPTQQDEQGVMAFQIAEMRNFADLARKLNPQQFSLRTPREIYKLTKKSLASLERHISLGPLFLNPDTKSGVSYLFGRIQGMFQKLQVR